MTGARKKSRDEEPLTRWTRQGRRKRLGWQYAELYYRLRTTEDSPLRQGWAIALGAFVGCSPLWGIHLPISIFLSRVFRLSVVKTTLATQISNPLFAPFLLFAEFGVGRRLLTGHFPAISLHEVSNLGLKELGLSLVLGSIVLGVAIGMVLGLIALVIGLLTREPTFLNKLVDTVSRRYVNTGILHWEFVRGKLFYDRVYRRILREGLLPGEGTIVDLGCGRGILLSLLAADERLAGDPERPVGWPRPGGPRTYRGIEQNKALYRCGRRALRGLAKLECGGRRDTPVPRCCGGGSSATTGEWRWSPSSLRAARQTSTRVCASSRGCASSSGPKKRRIQTFAFT